MAPTRYAAALVGLILVVVGCSDSGNDTAAVVTSSVAAGSPDASAATSPATTGSVVTASPTPVTASPTPVTTTTTHVTTTVTTAPPLRPPSLQISDPLVGRVITTRAYTFRGTSNPGVIVAVGHNTARVDGRGDWALALLLPPGSSATTVVAADPETGLSTTVRLALRYEPDVVLEVGSSDVVPCGTPSAEAMELLAGLLGEPAAAGIGGGEAEWRWFEGGFVAKFSDWSFCTMGEDVDEYSHFMGWRLTGDSAGLSLRGIAPGSTVADLMVEVEADHCEDEREEGRPPTQGCVILRSDDAGHRFIVSDGAMPPSIFGYATDPDPATATIVTLETEAPH